MATTDAKSGFRLPWSSDRPNDEPTGSRRRADCRGGCTRGWPSEDAGPAARRRRRPRRLPRCEAEAEAAVAARAGARRRAAAAAPVRPKKPNKFLADLTKAMQAAAEDARSPRAQPAPGRGEDPHRVDPRPVRDRGRRPAPRRRRRRRRHPRVVEGRDRPDPRGDRAPDHRPQGRPRERDRGACRASSSTRSRPSSRPVAGFEARDGRLLRAPPRRGRPDPLRHDGREPARAAVVRRPSPSPVVGRGRPHEAVARPR